jgi:aminoglycoside phosphotransferase (APT) family kinase protein
MADLTNPGLTELLRVRLGDQVECTAVRRGPAGNGQETWFVEVMGPDGPRSLVLRRTAVAGTMSHTDRAHEFETLRRVAATGLPVPRVHWYEAAGGPLERDYFVMDRLPGEAPSRAGAATLEAVARQLGEQLARLHRLGGAGIGSREATRAELAAWGRRYREGRPAPVPLLGALLAWLERNLPSLEGEAVLCWGDPGPHNLLVLEGRISGLLDWELSHPGHPLDDLAVAVWSCLGQLDPELVVAGYEAASGAPVDRRLLDWFEVLASVTRGVAMLAGVAAFVEGRINAPTTAGLGLELLGASLERGARAAGWEPVEAPALAATDAAEPRLLPSPAQADRGVARLLASEVLPVVDDARTRRLLKSAAALLQTGAERAEVAASLAAWRAAEREPLLAELRHAGLPAGDLESAAVAVEANDLFAAWRPRLRRHLLQDLAAERAAFGPLRALYGTAAAAAPRQAGG